MEEGPAKTTLAVSLAALLLNSSEAEISEENLSSVLKASGVDVSSALCAQWAQWIEKAGGVKQFLQGPSAGGGGGGGGAGGGMCLIAWRISGGNNGGGGAAMVPWIVRLCRLLQLSGYCCGGRL